MHNNNQLYYLVGLHEVECIKRSKIAWIYVSNMSDRGKAIYCLEVYVQCNMFTQHKCFY